MKESKKIAVVCNYRLMPDRVGGMDRFFWLFDAKSKEKGHEIIWFFPNNEKHEGYAKLDIVSPSDTTSLDTFFISYCKSHKFEFDIVITHFFELCTPFFKEVKQMFSCMTIAVDHNSKPREGFPIKKRITKKIRSFFFSKYTNLFIGVSNYSVRNIQEDYGAFLKRKIKMVYNGIDYNLFDKNLARKKEKPRFLVASSLRYIKGIQDLLDAIAALPIEIKNEIKVDVYGEGYYEAVLRAKILELSLENNVSFKGSSSVMHQIYSSYDYMIQPTYMECFSLTILESLSANVPVITTTVGGNLEVVQEGLNGFVFEPKDITKLTQLLQDLWMGKIGISNEVHSLIRDKFTLEKMVDNHYNLLNL